MKNLKKLTITAILMIFSSINLQAFAEGVGIIDFRKIYENYDYAQAVVKEIDAKGIELQQYLVDKEKQLKSLDTPLKQQNFKQKVEKEFQTKQSDYVTFKMKKEEDIYNKIQAAAKQVLVEQKLDAIVNYNIIFVGGVDVTDLVLTKLKGIK